MHGLTKRTYLSKDQVKRGILIGAYVLLSPFLFVLKGLPPLIYYLLILTYCAMGYMVLMQIIDAVIGLNKRLKLWELRKHLRKNNGC
ncbi:hypothetical protein HZI73_14140 [Vallitalea pronyensis]|uniref:Uncharacterized protein n=1 Tax=Vallitalea pronyensis TaxID=1348613 RepID=A0A8J8MKV5_9FIRM|nr:hypothetical protein [Vallitalea pronyensis]QUI23359.1 hypothetical protein HZI73_14140 [Vallitalea pronyensis]